MSESTTFGPLELAPGASRRLDRWLRRLVHARLAGLVGGRIALVDPEGARTFGSGEDLSARVQVRDLRFYRRLLLGGEVGAIESHADGDWDCDDPVALARILLRSREVLEGLGSGPARAAGGLRRLQHRRRRNTRSGSRRNIAAHYDLGNDFYELFLDETLTYSAGIFEREDATLAEASTAKYERLCRKLDLRPGDRVLEIGTGWGGFALHAAGRHGCHVTTTTISQEQHARARERIAAAGLEDRVTLLLEDYRDLRGRFDKLVSIEMIEAVGHEYHEAFFRACRERLAPDGLMALQAITVADQHYERMRKDVDFIKQHVFPGGSLLSVARIADVGAAAGGLRVVHLEDITRHYAETLRRWRRNLDRRRDDARALGCAEPFLRMWDFYLAYCQAGFDERWIGSVQVLLAGPGYRGPGVLGSLDPPAAVRA